LALTSTIRARPAASKWVSAELSIYVHGIRGDLENRPQEADAVSMAASTTRTSPEQLYRLLADNATDVVTLHDLEGHYLYVSPSIRSFGGHTPEGLVGRSCWSLIHPDDSASVQRAMARTLAGGEIVTVEYRFRDANGDYEWVETTARSVGEEIQCSSRKVTERRLAQAELATRLAQQAAVARLGDLVMLRPDLEEVLDAATAVVAETLQAEFVAVIEHEAEGRDVLRAGLGWRDGFVGAEFDPAVLREHDVVSSATVLIGRPEQPLGVLTASTRTVRQFRDSDVDFLQSVAHMLAAAIGRGRWEEQMRHDALHDALTGLPNRTLLLDRLRQALTRAEREGGLVAVLFLDLDNLKVINDSLGHGAGDELLRAIGPRLRGELRASDTVARFGGDEFAVVCEDVQDSEHALAIAQRLVRAFEDPFTVGGEERVGSASVGVVVTPAGRPAEELLSDADAAMYQAKERGRGRYELFDAGLRDRITARLHLDADLRRALEGEGRLWVVYQPYYRLPSRQIAGVEALVRWEHPERGNVPPAEFIPVAEESGLVVPLGERVLRAACEQVARWQRETQHESLRLTVNVSARQMAAPDFVDTVRTILDDTGLHADSLGLEITERLLLEETPGTALTIERLQTLGVRLLLDDFGTGYSSLRYLQRYPLDGLKVDRAFVAGLGEQGDGDGAIVEAIVGMARALGMGVIPEGIETDGQLQRLVAMGCDHAQGFLLSRPLPGDESVGPL
jgi:diguanylate cyclase (GGDEF)-like protein/PAS domain S-box-containing protein